MAGISENSQHEDVSIMPINAMKMSDDVNGLSSEAKNALYVALKNDKELFLKLPIDFRELLSIEIDKEYKTIIAMGKVPSFISGSVSLHTGMGIVMGADTLTDKSRSTILNGPENILEFVQGLPDILIKDKFLKHIEALLKEDDLIYPKGGKEWIALKERYENIDANGNKIMPLNKDNKTDKSIGVNIEEMLDKKIISERLIRKIKEMNDRLEIDTYHISYLSSIISNNLDNRKSIVENIAETLNKISDLMLSDEKIMAKLYNTIHGKLSLNDYRLLIEKINSKRIKEYFKERDDKNYR